MDSGEFIDTRKFNLFLEKLCLKKRKQMLNYSTAKISVMPSAIKAINEHFSIDS